MCGEWFILESDKGSKEPDTFNTFEEAEVVAKEKSRMLNTRCKVVKA